MNASRPVKRVIYTPCPAKDQMETLDRVPGLGWKDGSKATGIKVRGNEYLSFGWDRDKSLTSCVGKEWAKEHGAILPWPEFLAEVRSYFEWTQEDL